MSKRKFYFWELKGWNDLKEKAVDQDWITDVSFSSFHFLVVMCVHMHVYVHSNTHTCMHTLAHAHTYILILIHPHVHLYTHIHAHIHLHLHTHTHTHGTYGGSRGVHVECQSLTSVSSPSLTLSLHHSPLFKIFSHWTSRYQIPGYSWLCIPGSGTTGSCYKPWVFCVCLELTSGRFSCLSSKLITDWAISPDSTVAFCDDVAMNSDKASV